MSLEEVSFMEKRLMIGEETLRPGIKIKDGNDWRMRFAGILKLRLEV